MVACMEFSAARWGINTGDRDKCRRDVIGVMKKVDGHYERILFARSTPNGLVNVRVRGGCRTR